MKFGFYTDTELPEGDYRCPSWVPVPEGKKNVVVLGCSHTYGEGLDDNEHWVHFLSQHNTERLRYWNLGQPGASADKMVRILYGSEKVLFPEIIIACWPAWSRRERLDLYPQSLTSDNSELGTETEDTDRNNFLKNVFFVEKFAEKTDAKVFHCFAQDVYDLPQTSNVFNETTIKRCWPVWDHYLGEGSQRESITRHSVAKDGKHYGVEHHKQFASMFLAKFKHQLK